MLQWFIRFPELAEFTEFLLHLGQISLFCLCFISSYLIHLYRCCCSMSYVSFQSTFNNNSCHSCQNFLCRWWVLDLIVFLYLQMLLLYSTLFVILSLCTCPVTSLRACGGELTNLLMEHCGEVKRMDLPPIKRMGSDSESFEDNELREHDGYPDVFQKGTSVLRF